MFEFMKLFYFIIRIYTFHFSCLVYTFDVLHVLYDNYIHNIMLCIVLYDTVKYTL